MKPWELDSSQVTIMRAYNATIYMEDGDKYHITFYDENCDIVEATIKKEYFINFPYSIEDGTYFGLIVYTLKGHPGVTTAPWPIMRYWSKSLQALKNTEEASDD
jgi:hypothetical protein